MNTEECISMHLHIYIFFSFIMDTFKKLSYKTHTWPSLQSYICAQTSEKPRPCCIPPSCVSVYVCVFVSETDLVEWGGWRDDLIRKGNFPTVCTQSLLSKGELKEKEKKFNTLDKKSLISIYNLSKKRHLSSNI